MAGEEGSTRDDALGGRMKLIASKIDSKIFFHKDAVMEYMDMKHMFGELIEEKARIEQEACRTLDAAPPELLTPVLERLVAAKEELAAAKKEVTATNEELAAAKDELAETKEELADTKEELAAAKEEVAETVEYLAVAKEEIADTKEEVTAANAELTATMEQIAAAAEELAATNKEGLVAVSAELDAAREELEATKEQLEAAKEQLDEKDEQLKAVTMKVREMETMRNQEAQQSASETGLDSDRCKPTRRETGSIPGHGTPHRDVGSNALRAQQFGHQVAVNYSANDFKVLRGTLIKQSGLQGAGLCASSDDDLEVLRGTLIKEFMQLDCGGRILGVKEMGKLNRKPFHAACAAKLPPKEAEKAASKLYTAWEKLVKNPSWKPFKTVAVGDGRQGDVVDVDDDTLQELKRTWGESAHDAVISALMEMREYNHLDDRINTYELWNYKAGRKATTMECVEYMSNQVKQLSAAKRRKTRGTAGTA